MPLATKLLAEINAALENGQEDGRRKHLGASLIGRDCARELWYIFRWAKNVKHDGKLLRIFYRGHDEEARLIKMLRDAGVVVYEKDSKGKQYRISDHHGHFGGSTDAIATGVPDLDEPCLLEFKTHNDKSFSTLIAKGGVRDGKWEHYVQIQIYLHKFQLNWCVYIAVNKDTDELHIELVYKDLQVAEQYLLRAGQIIASPQPLHRISNNKTWYRCKFCDFYNVCHNGEKMDANCRTCRHSTPAEHGQWACTKYNAILTDAQQRVGCTSYEPIDAAS